MFKNWTWVLAVVVLLSGCAQLGSTEGQGQAVRIEGTPGMAVVYIVRTRPDVSYLTAPVVVNDRLVGATYAGTYVRVELPAGRVRISGYASDNGGMTMDVQPDRIYFVQHSVVGSWRSTSPQSFFRMIDEARARSAMSGASRIG